MPNKSIDATAEQDDPAIGHKISQIWIEQRRNLRQIRDDTGLGIGVVSGRLNEILKQKLQAELKKHGKAGTF
jgi:hypothetical protein